MFVPVLIHVQVLFLGTLVTVAKYIVQRHYSWIKIDKGVNL